MKINWLSLLGLLVCCWLLGESLEVLGCPVWGRIGASFLLGWFWPPLLVQGENEE